MHYTSGHQGTWNACCLHLKRDQVKDKMNNNEFLMRIKVIIINAVSIKSIRSGNFTRSSILGATYTIAIACLILDFIDPDVIIT